MYKQPAKSLKSYTAPFWAMLSISVLKIASNALLYIYIKTVINTNQRSNHSSTAFFLIFWPALLTIETVMYWLIRKKHFKRMFAWLHVISVFTGYVFLPVITFIINIYMSRVYSPHDYKLSIPFVGQAQFYLFWFLFIIGHAFFITTIVKSFTKGKVTIDGDEAAPGVLDGILDEY